MKLAALAVMGMAAWFCFATFGDTSSERGGGASLAPVLEGAWHVTVSQPDGSRFPSLVTFGAGGALVVTDSSRPPADGHAYQGTWVRTGAREATFSFLGFLYDAGVLANYIRVRETISLDKSGLFYDSLESTVEILDLDMNVLITIPSTTHGERISAL